jgi:hypothetical protein
MPKQRRPVDSLADSGLVGWGFDSDFLGAHDIWHEQRNPARPLPKTVHAGLYSRQDYSFDLIRLRTGAATRVAVDVECYIENDGLTQAEAAAADGNSHSDHASDSQGR